MESLPPRIQERLEHIINWALSDSQECKVTEFYLLKVLKEYATQGYDVRKFYKLYDEYNRKKEST